MPAALAQQPAAAFLAGESLVCSSSRHRESEQIDDGSGDSQRWCAAPTLSLQWGGLAAGGWCSPILASTGHVPDSSLYPWLGEAPLSLSGFCSQSHLPAGHSTRQDSSLTLVRWGLQLFLALACAICLFSEHPCRICVLAG